MHCFASENQTWTGTVILGVESLKSLKFQQNLLLKNLQLKTRVENVRFLSWRTFFVGKSVFKAPTKWPLKGLKLYASFRFAAIRFDAPTLLSFGGCTHAHAKCPSVDEHSLVVRKCIDGRFPLYFKVARLDHSGSQVWAWYVAINIKIWKIYHHSCIRWKWKFVMIRLLQQQNDNIAYLIAVDFARSLNYRRLLRVVFSSQQRLNWPALFAVQWRHHPKTGWWLCLVNCPNIRIIMKHFSSIIARGVQKILSQTAKSPLSSNWTTNEESLRIVGRFFI